MLINLHENYNNCHGNTVIKDTVSALDIDALIAVITLIHTSDRIRQSQVTIVPGEYPEMWGSAHSHYPYASELSQG